MTNSHFSGWVIPPFSLKSDLPTSGGAVWWTRGTRLVQFTLNRAPNRKKKKKPKPTITCEECVPVSRSLWRTKGLRFPLHFITSSTNYSMFSSVPTSETTQRFVLEHRLRRTMLPTPPQQHDPSPPAPGEDSPASPRFLPASPEHAPPRHPNGGGRAWSSGRENTALPLMFPYCACLMINHRPQSCVAFTLWKQVKWNTCKSVISIRLEKGRTWCFLSTIISSPAVLTDRVSIRWILTFHPYSCWRQSLISWDFRILLKKEISIYFHTLLKLFCISLKVNF